MSLMTSLIWEKGQGDQPTDPIESVEAKSFVRSARIVRAFTDAGGYCLI